MDIPSNILWSEEKIAVASIAGWVEKIHVLLIDETKKNRSVL